MRPILSRGAAAVLERFARSDVLLAFDFDGTLAPIVTDPAGAALRPVTRALIEAAARKYPVVVLSGRSRADTARRLPASLRVVGNHGIEPSPHQDRFALAVRRWRRALAGRLAGLPGVVVEDKVYSVSIHYRRSPAKRAARAAILAAAAELGPLRIVGGKQVVNLLPEGAPHKGIALVRERKRRGCDAAIYVGDDETDEDVFAMDAPWPLLGIRVGEKRRSGARYYLRDQRDIDRLLAALIGLR